MTDMAVDDAGSSTIVLLLNMRPCSNDAEDVMDSWIKYLSDSGGPVAAWIIQTSGGGKWDEWVASPSHRTGVDGLRRPSGHVKTTGGLVRLLVRRGAPSDVEQIVEPLKKSATGMPNGMAFEISNISLSHNAWKLVN